MSIMKKKKLFQLIVMVISLAMLLSGCGMLVPETDTVSGSISSVKQAFYASNIPETSDAVQVGNIYAYDFRESRTYGYTGYGDQCIDFEAITGLKLSAKNSTVTYSLYSHNEVVSNSGSVRVFEYSNSSKTLKSLNAKKDTNRTFSVKDFKNGLYCVELTLGIKDSKYPVSGYIYVTNGTAKTCRVSSDIFLVSSMNNWNYLMKDADPKNYLSNAEITYPTSGLNGNCVQTKKWEDMSDTIIVNDSWTDEARVFALAKWLSDNTAYDTYRARTSKMASRAKQANDYKSDKYWMYSNHVGICWDYANVLTIMCRHQGIPATSVEGDGHTICAVWLNGSWVGIDVTETVTHSCETKDTSSSKWKYVGSNWSGYGRYDGSMFHHDGEIWTKSVGTTYWGN